MTREEAKQYLIAPTILSNGNPNNDPAAKHFEAYKMAIKALEQEPCEDLISRKELDKALYERFHEEDSLNNITDVRLGAVRNFVKDFPSTVNPQVPKWIPVSERLPEEFESVLVCYKSQGGMAQCVSERLVNMDGSNRWTAMCGQEPIAWMPIPKYKESNNE